FAIDRAVTDPRDGRRVALKKLPNVFQSLVSSKRVFRELKMLCFFKHENVLSALDILQPPHLDFFQEIVRNLTRSYKIGTNVRNKCEKRKSTEYWTFNGLWLCTAMRSGFDRTNYERRILESPGVKLCQNQSVIGSECINYKLKIYKLQLYFLVI
ncbi:Serine/threonine-protein kinase NLK, partial [Melipona quadrifasciata]